MTTNDAESGEDGRAKRDASAIRSEFGNGTRRFRSEDGPVLRLQSGLYEIGKNLAVTGGALEPKAAELDGLKDHASAAANDARREKYDKDANPNDALREELFQRALKRRGAVSEALEHAEARLRTREEDLAAVPEAGTKPEIPVFLAFGAVLILALTVAPTLRDFLFDNFDDELLAWMLSLGAALGFGVFLAWSTLGAASGGSASSPAGGSSAAPRSRAALVGGATVAVGLGAWRLGSAEGMSDFVTAFALTALEFGVMLVLDWYAGVHRDYVDRWRARQDARAVAEAAVAAASTELKRRQDELAKIDEHVDSHVEYVEDRTLRNLGVEELSRAATTAVSDGYNAGIAENRGRRLGVRR